MSVECMTGSSPSTQIKENNKTDSTLATIRHLVDVDAEGYQWDYGLVFRRRLDSWGVPYSQLCLPAQYALKWHMRNQDTGSEDW